MSTSRNRRVATATAGAAFAAAGYLIGGNALNPTVGRIIGAAVGLGIALLAGRFVKVEEASAESNPQTTAIGRAILLAIVLGVVGVVVGAVLGQYTGAGGVGPAGAKNRETATIALVAVGGLLGLVGGALVGGLAWGRTGGSKKP